jgi:copper(I)-binding protein
VLQPGGYHVMLIGLKQPLKAGQMVALTLKFSNDQVVSIEAPVQKIMMKHMQHQPKHHHGH